MCFPNLCLSTKTLSSIDLFVFNYASINRMAAYELCLFAKSTPAQKVLLVLATKKQAEQYCLRLRRKGLPVTIEPHDIERQ